MTRIVAVSPHADDAVVTYAALGDHVDHVRARDATLAAAARTGTEVTLWQDMPYATRSDRLAPLPRGAALSAAVIEPVDPEAWRTKLRALDYYGSQHRM